MTSRFGLTKVLCPPAMSSRSCMSIAPSPPAAARKLCQFLLLAVLCVVGLLGGCANEVDVFTGREGVYFSVQGALRVSDDTHFVRIEPLQDGIPFGTDSTIDATVTMENLATGETTRLNDSLVRFDGVLAHNFWTPMRLESGTRYRLTVERSDGKTTVAEATTPTQAVEPEVVRTAPHCQGTTFVTFPGDIGLVGAEVGFLTTERNAWVRFPIQNTRSEQETSFSFIPECEMAPIVGRVDTTAGQFLLITRCTRLQSDTIPVAYSQVGPDWPVVEDQSDQSTRVSRAANVEGGTGFFGFSRRDTFVTTVDKDLRPAFDYRQTRKSFCSRYEPQQ